MPPSPLTLSVHLSPGFPLVDPSGRYEGLSHWSPSTSTLITGPTSSLLIDIPFIASQALTLANWVTTILPNAQAHPLTAVYITHGHGDHFLGLPIILKAFPQAKVCAVPSVISHMRQQADPANLKMTYDYAFHGELQLEGLAEILDRVIPLETEAQRTMELDGSQVHFIEAGQSDCAHSTFVHVPSLKAVVAGDIVYNGVHQHVGEARTKETREAWIRSVQMIEALQPEVVVAGHKKAGESDGVGEGFGGCHETIRYLRRLERLVEMSASWEDLFDEMLLEFPDRENKDILRMGAKTLF